jgi:rhamnosyltransferase
MMMIFCAKALFNAIRYIKENSLNNVILYILGVRIGPLFLFMRYKLIKMNVNVIINPDGLEWTRARWNWFIKWYLQISEKMMLQNSDYIVCDSKAVLNYIKEKYKKLKAQVKYISYGANIEGNSPVINNIAKDFFTKFRIIPFNYFLIVARFVPENNISLIIKEFMCTKTQKDLVIISNVEKNRFFYSLKKLTDFDKDKRIKFVGTVYNSELLISIRKQAFAYLHGHMAGGTNPSLLESMSATKLNVLFNVVFNREVGKEAVLYFNESPGSLAQIIDMVENITDEEIQIYDRKAKNIIINDYSWDKVIKQYKLLFSDILSNTRLNKLVHNESSSLKIAVITILSKNNYGAILQGYALFKFLSRLGNDVMMIDYFPKENNQGLKWLFHSVFLWYLRKRRKKLGTFIEQNMTLTSKKYNSYNQLYKEPPRADAYIVGSDQVWSEKIFQGGVNYGFLQGFVNNKKKISYASSIGEEKISEDSLKRIAYYIQDFQHISVREKSAKELLMKAGLDDIQVVLDPVFLLNGNKYRELAISFKTSYKYLLIYAFEGNKKINKLSKALSKAYGLKIVEIGGAFQKSDSDLFLIDLGVEEFLGVLINAEYIITTSFHGTALSIILQKQFVNVLPRKRSDRIVNLLKIFELEDRVILDHMNFDPNPEFKTIDYHKIDKKKKDIIKISSEYLLNSLKFN